MLAAMEAVPGVEHATGSWSMPLVMGLWLESVMAQERSPLCRPYYQNPGRNGIRLVLTAKTVIDAGGISSEIEAAARSAYPAVLLREGSIMSVAVSETATDQRYRALLVATFGAVVVILASVGILSLVARAIAQRSHELVIRSALGAEPRLLQFSVCLGTLKMAAIGAGSGLLAASWGGRFI
ncbi:MAG TPA: hypothetical protein EYQ02_05220 [Microbacterium sp.]|jgi:putative ABC transport system permease protein|nr:hypothetical protein [Microbacterium sp.]